jgi:hypothetical protein
MKELVIGLTLIAIASSAFGSCNAQAQSRDPFPSLGSVNGCELYRAPDRCHVLICETSASLDCP